MCALSEVSDQPKPLTTEDERQFIVSIICDLAPRDAVERMLAVQMAATHVATIRAGRSIARSDPLPQIEAH